MKLVCSILFALIFSLVAEAQKVYFIYLQTENNIPFFVKMDDRIYSATTAGYLILPELSDSTYQISIGFPPSGSESRFSVRLAGRDRGYLIKQSDRGPGLLDLQTSALIRPQKNELDKNISYQARNDAFTLLLAKAAHDTSLLLVPVVVKEDVVVTSKPEKPEVKKEENDMGRVIDSPVAVKIDPVKKDEVRVSDPVLTDQKTEKLSDTNSAGVVIPVVKKETGDKVAAGPDEIYLRSVVKKQSESSTSEGFGLVFQDIHQTGIDTIRLLIPNPRFGFRQPDTLVSKVPGKVISNEEIRKQEPAVPEKADGQKTDCNAVASDNDFFKLRKNMASKMTDESMLTEARKYFRTKCFSTQQLRNLSTLFLTASGKYDFFSAAYLRVTDPGQFGSLQSEFKDDYYSKRFKALVGD